MKKTAIGLSLAALVLGGGAYAAPKTPDTAPTLNRDADRSRVLTRAAVQSAATESFGRLDVNKDGKLDRADRDARREATKTRMFEQLDTNKDGQIARAEFMANRAPGMNGAREGRRGMGRPQGGPGRMPGRMMGGKRPGAGASGSMTQAEFVSAALQRFDARDADKDGQLTQAERQTAREQRKAQRQQARAQRTQG
jgi:hypothetical protein